MGILFGFSDLEKWPDLKNEPFIGKHLSYWKK